MLQRVIVDADVGSDDFLAILLLFKALLAHPKLKIEAFVCSNGNTEVEHTCENLIRILELTNHTDIPVYRGSSKSLIGPSGEYDYYHGRDGFGDLPHTDKPDLSLLKSTPAAIAVGNLIETYPGEISLICMAPLTNVALMLRLYGKTVQQNLKSIWILGGNYKGIGNTSPSAEFNFYTDVEAAHIVLNETKKPTFIFPWETCLASSISWNWRWNVFGTKNSKEIDLLNRVERSVYKDKNEESWMPCDAFLMATFLHPEQIIEKIDEEHLDVELVGQLTRGQGVVNHYKKQTPNVNIIKKINVNFFKSLLMDL